MTSVPFVDLKAQYQSIKSEIDAAISSVIAETAFIKGPFVSSFEKSFASFIGTSHCIGCGNGTDALEIALKALDIGNGDEVIVPANSFIATSEAVTSVGARVVFVDSNTDTYTIDVSKIEERITSKTKAIIPVHLYGLPVEMDELMALAKHYNLRVIEDCAQAHAAEYKGKRIGTFGDFATFSFFPGKNLGAYGDGGAIVTNDERLALQAQMIANHGRVGKYDHDFEGRNSRLDGLQAAILSAKLPHLEQWTEHRRSNALYYSEVLKKLDLITPVAPEYSRHVYHLYVVRVKDRDRVQNYLKDKGIATGVHYPIPLPFLNAYKYLNHSQADFPVAASQQHEILSLPMFPELTTEHIDYVAEQLSAAL